MDSLLSGKLNGRLQVQNVIFGFSFAKGGKEKIPLFGKEGVGEI
jgi:hypothetical protein